MKSQAPHVMWDSHFIQHSFLQDSNATCSGIVTPARWARAKKVRVPIVFFWVSKNIRLLVAGFKPKTQHVFGAWHHKNHSSYWHTQLPRWCQGQSSPPTRPCRIWAGSCGGSNGPSFEKKHDKLKMTTPQTTKLSEFSWPSHPIPVASYGGYIRIFEKMHEIRNDDPSWLHHRGIMPGPHWLVIFLLRLLLMVKVREGEECPPSRCDMRIMSLELATFQVSRMDGSFWRCFISTYITWPTWPNDSSTNQSWHWNPGGIHIDGYITNMHDLLQPWYTYI